MAGNDWTAADERRSAKSESAFLILPFERQLNFPDHLLCCEFDGVCSFSDCIDDLWCQKRQGKDASDVALVDPLKRREFGQCGDLSGEQRIEAAMRAGNLPEKHGIHGVARRRIFDDEPHLDPATPNLQRNVARDNERGEIWGQRMLVK